MIVEEAENYKRENNTSYPNASYIAKKIKLDSHTVGKTLKKMEYRLVSQKYDEKIINKINEMAQKYNREYETQFPSATYIAKKIKLDRHGVARVLIDLGYTLIKANHGKRNGAKKGKENHLFGKKQSQKTQEKKRSKLIERKRPPELFKKIIQTRIKNGTVVPSYSNVKYYSDLKMEFRSLWEANYARLLNHMNIKWEYEAKIFELYDSSNKYIGTYTPDFYLVDSETFVEVKGFFSEKNKEKMSYFHQSHPNVNLKYIHKTDYKKLEESFSDIVPNWNQKRSYSL